MAMRCVVQVGPSTVARLQRFAGHGHHQSDIDMSYLCDHILYLCLILMTLCVVGKLPLVRFGSTETCLQGDVDAIMWM